MSNDKEHGCSKFFNSLEALGARRHRKLAYKRVITGHANKIFNRNLNIEHRKVAIDDAWTIIACFSLTPKHFVTSRTKICKYHFDYLSLYVKVICWWYMISALSLLLAYMPMLDSPFTFRLNIQALQIAVLFRHSGNWRIDKQK